MVVLRQFAKGSSSSSSLFNYDVFLSFRGSDTRSSFISHLHSALMKANFATFLEDGVFQTGLELKPELESAIKASRASIIVLSENYAASTWCLEELVLILDQRLISDHIVIPVFYHVEPILVRKQQGSYGDAMSTHKQRMKAETDLEKRTLWNLKMELWKRALREVADIKGHVVNGRLETEIIEEIILDIRHLLGIALRSILPDLIGVDYHARFIISWLEDSSSDTITIVGVGGIGKTCLAKLIYESHCHLFKRSSFIGDIGRTCSEESDKLLDLQKQLCADISNTRSVQREDVSVYISKIQIALEHKKVLIVLDDVDSLDQLNALLGSSWFYPGSKIIITTKDESLTQRYKLANPIVQPNHMVLRLRGLNETSSLQLLSFHAFKGIGPTDGYRKVSKTLAQFCEGHPLALKVLGRSLYDREVAEWEEFIGRLKKETDSSIRKALRLSFDLLPSQNDKELFKHIACFFVGKDKEVTEIVLKACGIRTVLGIRNLLDRCLLTIGPGNQLMMHQLLQEMGRDVVRQESLNKPWKRSRLWCHEESFNVLKQKKGGGNLKGIVLDMRMLGKEKFHGSLELKTDALSKMDNLMLLQLNHVQISGSYEHFPQKLRWLCMHGFPSQSIPPGLRMENLVVLDMSYSNLESFDMSYSNMQRPRKRRRLIGSHSKDKWLGGSLKILNLSFCCQLRSLSGFVELPALESLVLASCTNLIEICESIEQCNELVLIDLSNCNMLKKLPRSLGKLKKVKSLLLDGCNSDESQIEVISRDFKSFTIYFPRSLVRLSLANNNLSNESFPMDFHNLAMLKDLQLDSNPIISLPIGVSSLPRLEKLSLNNCKMLKSIEHPPSTLRRLILELYGWPYKYKHLLRKIVFYPEMSPLELLVPLYLFAPSSFEIEGIVKIQPIAVVEEKILRSLGWTDLRFIKGRRLGTYHLFRGSEESKIQMYYEFGIFSTIYGGEAIPYWMGYISKGSSISFTMPSSPKNVRGLNICYVQTFRIPSGTFQFPYYKLFHLPLIIICNITKNHTWIYRHYIESVSVDRKCLIFLSYWMFGMDEMEGGDQVTITVTEERDQVTSECGINLVYDDGNIQEEDPLGYYKSWNHIIGGDLSAFQLTTGEYILDNLRFTWYSSEISSFYHPFIADGASYKEGEVHFRAFS